MKKLPAFLILGVLWTGIAAGPCQALEAPRLGKAHVYDGAGILDDETKAYLERVLKALEKKSRGRVHFTVAVFRSLEGTKIEDFYEQYDGQWEKMDPRSRPQNRVHFLIFLEEKRLRFGRTPGMVPHFSYEISGDILRYVVLPRFREKLYQEGITQGVEKAVGMLVLNAA